MMSSVSRSRLLARASLLTWAVAATLAGGARAETPGGASTLILVRHADKLDTSNDTELSPAGHARAAALAESLKDAGVTAIITTSYRRTQQTAQPLATMLGIRPTVVTVRWPIEDHVADVKAAVLKALPGVVLVVGHANTIVDLMASLNGPRLPEICDAVYNNIFVLYEHQGRTRAVHTRYGADTPDDLPACR